MNRKQRKERLKRFKLAKKMRRRTEALRRLRDLPPGTYQGRAHMQGGSFGMLVQTAHGHRFLPVLRIPSETAPQLPIETDK